MFLYPAHLLSFLLSNITIMSIKFSMYADITNSCLGSLRCCSFGALDTDITVKALANLIKWPRESSQSFIMEAERLKGWLRVRMDSLHPEPQWNEALDW